MCGVCGQPWLARRGAWHTLNLKHGGRVRRSGEAKEGLYFRIPRLSVSVRPRMCVGLEYISTEFPLSHSS